LISNDTLRVAIRPVQGWRPVGRRAVKAGQDHDQTNYLELIPLLTCLFFCRSATNRTDEVSPLTNCFVLDSDYNQRFELRPTGKTKVNKEVSTGPSTGTFCVTLYSVRKYYY
jgi:hypothetical protein